ncbi:MAG: hypothetical protein ACJAYC_000578 [Halieaceae bacterium]
MKSLAEFVMRGRFQALLVTLAGAGSLMFCWISAAVIALVTLRQGLGQGAWLLMWALLPAGVLLYAFGDSSPLLLLIGTSVLALVLRGTVSLQLTILAGIAVGGVTGVALIAFGGEFLDQLVEFFAEFLTNLEQQLSDGGQQQIELVRPTALQLAGMMGAGNGFGTVMCLLLARYWQAALYNPGGFSEEFQALRYSPTLALAMSGAAIAVASLGPDYRTWAIICMIPLNFAGLALVHARAQARGQGRGWLTGFYLAWLLFDPVKLIVVFAAIADSWMDFRQRWQKKQS